MVPAQHAKRRRGGHHLFTSLRATEEIIVLTPRSSSALSEIRVAAIRPAASPPDRWCSSRHSANRMRASRRARATIAIRRPRRAASCSTHACNAVRRRRCRQIVHAPWTSRVRTLDGPTLVIPPCRRRPPELSSRGTTPRYALTALASANRVTSSSAARKVSAVIGPTPGTVISRVATGSAAAAAVASASAASRTGARLSSTVSKGASVVVNASGTGRRR